MLRAKTLNSQLKTINPLGLLTQKSLLKYCSAKLIALPGFQRSAAENLLSADAWEIPGANYL